VRDASKHGTTPCIGVAANVAEPDEGKPIVAGCHEARPGRELSPSSHPLRGGARLRSLENGHPNRPPRAGKIPCDDRRASRRPPRRSTRSVEPHEPAGAGRAHVRKESLLAHFARSSGTAPCHPIGLQLSMVAQVTARGVRAAKSSPRPASW